MYKDKAKQKEAAKAALKRFRAKKKDHVTPEKGITDEIPSNEIPDEIPCTRQHCQNAREHGKVVFHVWKPHYELRGGQYNRVTLPGDEDYVGVA